MRLSSTSAVWRSCSVCGGVTLAVRPCAGTSRLPQIMLDPAAPGCPRCETRRRRLEPPADSPAVWYDTLLGDWVVRHPRDGTFACAVMPLGLRWYDLPWATVHHRAADLVFARDDD